MLAGEMVERWEAAGQIKQMRLKALSEDILIAVARILQGEQEKVLLIDEVPIILSHYVDDRISYYSVDVEETQVFAGIPYSDQVDYVLSDGGNWIKVLFAWEEALFGKPSNFELEYA